MKRISLSIVLLTFYFVSNCWATPAISKVDGIIDHSQSITISGLGFGTKDRSTPKYFNNFESEPVGGVPSQMTTSSKGGIVDTDLARGMWSKTMKFSYFSSGGSHFERNVFDLGEGGANNIYLTTWLYIDKTGSTATEQWQWKSMYVSSEPSGYTSSEPAATAAITNNWWYVNKSPDAWGNNSAFMYYNGVSSNGMSASIPGDAYLWGEWQRIEIQLKRSSSPGTGDAQFKIVRVGRSSGDLVNRTNAVSHSSGSRPWRYIAFGQEIGQVSGGTANVKLYYDDLYIDTTPARVEIGNSSSFANCTHREIQAFSAWSDSQIKVTVNQGSFPKGAQLYLFVIDANGNPSTGHPITMGESNSGVVSLPSPPSSPKNLRIVN